MTDLARKALAGVARMFAVFPLFIFLPAGTLRYWQGWLFFFSFAAYVIWITWYLWNHDPKLLERRLKAGPSAETTTSQKIIMSFAMLFSGLEVVIPALDHRFHWSQVPWPLVIAANLLLVLSYYFILLVFRVNSFTASTVQVVTDQTVVSTGPYALVRHPMYSAALLMFIAAPVALGSYVGLLCFPPLFAILAWRLLDEEKLLTKSLRGYADYKSKVRFHLVPYVW